MTSSTLTGGRVEVSTSFLLRLASLPSSDIFLSSSFSPILSAPLTAKARAISRLPTVPGEVWTKSRISASVGSPRFGFCGLAIGLPLGAGAWSGFGLFCLHGFLAGDFFAVFTFGSLPAFAAISAIASSSVSERGSVSRSSVALTLPNFT